MRRLLALVLLASWGCAAQVPIATSLPTSVSLIPKGTAVALQTSSAVVTGKLLHVDSAEILVLTPSGGFSSGTVTAFARDEVLTLYRRPGNRLGVGFALGSAVGAAAGYIVAGALCKRGTLPDCDSRGRYGDPEENQLVARGLFAGIGAMMFGGMGHEGDTGARGMDPSDWTQIPWPEWGTE
jgi:hypothetical protein